MFAKAEAPIRDDIFLEVTGVVQAPAAGTVDPDLKSGQVELVSRH